MHRAHPEVQFEVDLFLVFRGDKNKDRIQPAHHHRKHNSTIVSLERTPIVIVLHFFSFRPHEK
jgi:hypothetical protein